MYLAPGSELAFADWPFDRWEHPWQTAGPQRVARSRQADAAPAGDAYSVDLFWNGPARTFSGWYLNLQDPVRRYDGGFDTLDHELVGDRGDRPGRAGGRRGLSRDGCRPGPGSPAG